MKSIEIGCRPNRRKVLTAALSIGVASMLPGFALAASDGDPAALAFDGDTILLARGGLFVSDDDGRT
ncbi:MAG: exo-alpha-sialidase, partial [Albidovulum sp.]